MLHNLPIDILTYINTFNYVVDQKILKCVSKNFNMVKTGEYIDELCKYSRNFSDMNIAHKENSLHYSIANTKDKYNNECALLKNIWWFGIDGSFNVKRDKYIIMFDMNVPIVSKNYEIKITLNNIVINIKKNTFVNKCILLDIKEEGILNIAMDEHDTYKKNIIIKKIICVPYYVVARNISNDFNSKIFNLIVPNKYFEEIFQLCDCLKKYFLIKFTVCNTEYKAISEK